MKLSQALISLTLILSSLQYINWSTYPQQYEWDVRNPWKAQRHHRRGMTNFETNSDLYNQYNRFQFRNTMDGVEGLHHWNNDRLGDYTLDRSGVYTGMQNSVILDRIGLDDLDFFNERPESQAHGHQHHY